MKKGRSIVQRWEYKITQTLTTDELNELGKEGWELVAVDCVLRFEPTQELERWLYFKKQIDNVVEALAEQMLGRVPRG